LHVDRGLCPEAAFEVLKAWGFVHKTTAFIWAKQKESGEGWHIGQGRWTSPSSENCWLATRGKPKRLNGHVRQLIVAPATEQSLKPDEIHDRIERLVEGPYLELFASRQRRGWVTWGQEVKLEMPDAPSIDPESGEVEIISPSVICVPTQPSGNDGLGLPDFLRRGDPACAIGAMGAQRSIPVPETAGTTTHDGGQAAVVAVSQR
jgi:MT-A70